MRLWLKLPLETFCGQKRPLSIKLWRFVFVLKKEKEKENVNTDCRHRSRLHPRLFSNDVDYPLERRRASSRSVDKFFDVFDVFDVFDEILSRR